MSEYRNGIGYDVHAFADYRKLILGGVEIDYPRGLAGHSDADVVVHAVMDALLGAAGKGDIGRHFPDTDPAFKDVSSLALLHMVYEIVSGDGWTISNIDVTIIAQQPKVAAYIERMRTTMAAEIELDRERINVKATTTEKLGFVGREEGIAAMATATLFGDHV
jgi:2-C-methyl-D-erythritol 2,4-cyclodiphosphate synthase